MKLVKKTKDLTVRQEPSDKLKELCKNWGLDWHVIDWTSLFQNQKDYSKRAFIEEVIKPKLLQCGGVEPVTKAQIKEINEANEREAEKRFKKEIERVKKIEEEALKGYYKKSKETKLLESPCIEQMEKRILMVIRGNWVGTIIASRGGFGKTYSAQHLLNKEIPKKWVLIKCKTTPLQNYINLYNNKDKEVILFEDLEGLENTAEIMKSATDDATQKRIVQYNSTKLPKGIPKAFEIKARIIWLTNNINIKDEALKKRFTYYYLNPSYQEKVNMLKQLSEKTYKELTKEERNMLLDWIKINTDDANIEFNLRTLFKVFEYYRFDKQKWKKWALEEPDFKKDIAIATVMELVEKGIPIKQQIEKFKEITHKGRTTYYDTRQKIAQKIY